MKKVCPSVYVMRGWRDGMGACGRYVSGYLKEGWVVVSEVNFRHTCTHLSLFTCTQFWLYTDIVLVVATVNCDLHEKVLC